MKDEEIDLIIREYVEQTESGATLDLVTVRLIAQRVERITRWRCEDIAKKAAKTIGELH